MTLRHIFVDSFSFRYVFFFLVTFSCHTFTYYIDAGIFFLSFYYYNFLFLFNSEFKKMSCWVGCRELENKTIQMQIKNFVDVIFCMIWRKKIWKISIFVWLSIFIVNGCWMKLVLD